MKRQLCGFMLIGLWASGVVVAQPAGSTHEQAALQADAGGMDAQHDFDHAKKLEKRLAHMTKRYKLTPEQQAQVRSILVKEEQDTQTVSTDNFMSGRNKREEVVSLHDASQQKIGAILNKRQKHKFDVDERRRAWMDGRLPNPNPGPALNGGW